MNKSKSQERIRKSIKPPVPTENRAPKTVRQLDREFANGLIGVNPNLDANLITQLFPDRAIKAQNFIDLINLAQNTNAKTISALRVNNPNISREKDVQIAV